MRRFWLIVVMALCSVAAFAQDDVRFTVNAPGAVRLEEPFRVEFVINAQPERFDGDKIQMEGLEIIAGPSTAHSSSVSIVNGKQTKSVKYTYSYIVMATLEGEAVIHPATVIVDGKQYSTQMLKVAVVDEGKSESADSNSESASVGSTSRQTNTIGRDDLFIVLHLDRTKVYKGEPVKATLKLYTKVPLSGVENMRVPTFNGFWTQEQNNKGYTWQSEAYNGKVYDTHILNEYLLYPQQVGTLSIDPFELSVVAQIVVQQSNRQSMFDDFFGMMDVVQDVRKQLLTKTVTVDVQELPAGAPSSFTGAVGKFDIESELPSEHIGANSSAMYVVRIQGKGNLQLVQAPKLELPTSFEAYNVKTTESLRNTSSGASGYRQFEYPFIARAEGEFTIPAVEFSYFNPQTERYVTLSTRDIVISVDADTLARTAPSGIIGSVSKEDIEILDKDIRYIKLGKGGFLMKGDLLMWSPLYFSIVALLILLTALLYWVLKRAIRNRANSSFMRGKRANKVALQRLRLAREYMGKGNDRGFYDEMLKALWGYMSDKLNIPVSLLSKENIRAELTARGLAEEQSTKFIDIISECEMAQYSPEALGRMEDVYGESARLLSEIESLKMRKTRTTNGRRISMFLLVLQFVLAPMSGSAASVESLWSRANGAYADGDYAGALVLYDSIEQRNMVSADLFYNMGNAYFKNGDTGWAMLYYKKAERLSPSDEDIKYNINIVQNYVKDRIEEVPELFITRWWGAIRGLMSSDGWAVLSLVLLALTLAGLLLYVLPLMMRYRKLGFGIMVVGVLMTLLSMVFAAQQRRLVTDSDEAVVVVSSVSVKSSPNATSKDIFIIHEGTLVRVVETLDDWSEVVIADGNKGWVLSSSIERID